MMNNMIQKIMLMIVSLFVCQAIYAKEILKNGELQNNLTWEFKQFEGEVKFNVEQKDSKQALHVYANQSAGGAFVKTQVDLNQTPYLTWRWRVDEIIDNPNEREKKFDDYPLRLYVIYKPGRFMFSSKTLSFVYASQENQLDAYKSAYTKKIQIIAIEKGKENAGEWMEYKINIQQAYKNHFNLDVDEIHGIAIMSDSDNVGNIQQGWIESIKFVQK